MGGVKLKCYTAALEIVKARAAGLGDERRSRAAALTGLAVLRKIRRSLELSPRWGRQMEEMVR